MKYILTLLMIFSCVEDPIGENKSDPALSKNDTEDIEEILKGLGYRSESVTADVAAAHLAIAGKAGAER